MKSVMRHQFSQVPQAQIPRSKFDRSHGFKTTFDAGYLIPVFVDEALPGDTFNLQMTTFARLATPLKPFMDNLFCDAFFFAVPYRLVWTHFVNFFGEQANPADSTSFLVPQMVSTGYAVGSLHDYFALPTSPVTGYSHSSLWHRAYNLIWNTWFRDQNLQNSVTVDMGDGPDSPANYVLLRRGKRHDYFTSALPWPQKGPAVNIPLGGQAPVTGIGIDSGVSQVSSARTFYGTSGGSGSVPTVQISNASSGIAIDVQTMINASAPNSTTNKPQIFADLTQATAATINQLRQAFQIQKIYERDARGGTRYTELIQAHFGVTSPDARLQRPEYLGGGSVPITVTPVPQTTATGVTGATTPQGNLAAFATTSMHGVGFTKSFTEHCLLIGMVSVRADLNYQQGLPRMFSRQTRFDFYWPALSHIGEQAVLNQEIYCQGTPNLATDALTFGYQERFAEYRYKPSYITGQFRSTFATPLDVWHLAINFASLPALNATFIQDNPPIARVVAVPSQPQFLFDAYFRMACARPMPTYSVPGLIDHF